MIEIIDHATVREIKLARPPANALDGPMLDVIAAAIVEAPRAGARAIVLSGQPGMFSAGLDVPQLLRQSQDQMLTFWKSFFGTQQALAASEVPIAAAITGHSPAGGAVLALYCDYRVMASGAFRIGLNEVQVGLYPGPVIFGAFKRVVGQRQAELLLAGGVMLNSEEALRVGLVDKLVGEAEVIAAALEWAKRMAALPPRALALTRRLVRSELIALTAHFTDADYRAMNDAWFSTETQTTMRALVERLSKKG